MFKVTRRNFKRVDCLSLRFRRFQWWRRHSRVDDTTRTRIRTDMHACTILRTHMCTPHHPCVLFQSPTKSAHKNASRFRHSFCLLFAVFVTTNWDPKQAVRLQRLSRPTPRWPNSSEFIIDSAQPFLSCFIIARWMSLSLIRNFTNSFHRLIALFSTSLDGNNCTSEDVAAVKGLLERNKVCIFACKIAPWLLIPNQRTCKLIDPPVVALLYFSIYSLLFVSISRYRGPMLRCCFVSDQISFQKLAKEKKANPRFVDLGQLMCFI